MTSDAMRILQLLSRVATCPENCASCRACAAQLIESDIVGRIVDCPNCGLPWAETLGPCQCLVKAAEVDGRRNPWSPVDGALDDERPRDRVSTLRGPA